MRGEIPEAGSTAQERALLRLTLKITDHPAGLAPADVEAVRSEGLNDDQIAEAVFVAALFAFFNRVADAFGLNETEFPDPEL